MIRSEYRVWIDELSAPRLTIGQRVAKWFERSQSQPSGAREPISRAAPNAPPSAPCDLCKEPCGDFICTECTETILEAMSHVRSH